MPTHLLSMAKRTFALVAGTLLVLGAAVLLTRPGGGSPKPEATATLSVPERTPSPLAVARWKNLTDPAIHWQIRVAMLRREKDQDLSAEDAAALLDLLAYRPDSRAAESWWVVANEIMQRLAVRDMGGVRYPGTLLAIIQDAVAPEVLRDYAIQHLGQWIYPAGNASAAAARDAKTVAHILESLVATVRDPSLAHTSLPGTTLRVFADLKGRSFAPPLMQSALAALGDWFGGVISGDIQVSLITRTSAINAAGMLDMSEHLSAIRSLAYSSSGDPSIRLNAIAALGYLGCTDDLPQLEKIAGSSSRFRAAALTASRHISHS